jgi:hypothetical protein
MRYRLAQLQHGKETYTSLTLYIELSKYFSLLLDTPKTFA